MRILVTNDDGIHSKGITELARAAMALGDVYVIAPESECSAMSSRITVRDTMLARDHDFPLPVKKAFSLSGTPADCVKVGLAHLLEEHEKPDYVFSGINNGYNAGGDILYSGTVGAAMEALITGIPAIAWSNKMSGSFDSINEFLLPIAKEIMAKAPLEKEIWNVNFPGTDAGDCKGVLWDRAIAPFQFYLSRYEITESEKGTHFLAGGERYADELELDDTDMSAVMNGYVSVGKVRCNVL